MPYKLLLSDADGTLFNFHAGERIAISHTFSQFHIPVTEENKVLYHDINESHWKRLERGETTQARLRVERFADFLATLGSEENAQDMCDCFIESLAQQRILISGAKEFCEQVSASMPIYLVTNGIARVQRSRFTDCELSPYLRGLVISEEVGYSKPHPAMIDKALAMAGIANKHEVVLLGDSITADIAAANNAGIDSILFTNGGAVPAMHGATYTTLTLSDAKSLICGC